MKKTMVKLLAITLVLAMFMGVGGSAFALEIPSSSFQLPTVKVRDEEKPAPEQPAEEPTAEPTEAPSEEPTAEPTEEPVVEPTAEPTEEPAEAPADAIGKGTVSLEDDFDKLNVRAEGNSKGELLDKIANGETVYILATEGYWTKIRTASGLEGWVATSFLSIEEAPAEEPIEEPVVEPTEVPAEEPTAEPTEEPVEEVPADAIGKGTVSLEDDFDKLNVRAEGNSKGELLDKIANGEAVYILASEGGWTKIRTASGLEGWVASSFLSIEELPAEEPVEEELSAEEELLTEEELTTEEELLEQPAAEDIAYADIDVSQLKVEIATTQGDVVMMGETITLTSVLTGFDGLTYTMQWQYDDGSGWKNVDGATGDSYSFIADDNNIYFQWRLEVTL